MEDDKVVCVCNQVHYSEIIKALNQGGKPKTVQDGFKKVQDATMAAAGCGGCYQKVMDIISKELNQ